MNRDSGVNAVMGSLLGLPATAMGQSLSTEQFVAELFAEHRDAVYKHVLMMLWNPAESEDITQEAFLRLHRVLLEERSIENIKAWVFRVAHNAALDRMRSTRPTDSLSEVEILNRAEMKSAGSVSNPEQQLLHQERLRQVTCAVTRLPARQRECLNLKAEGFRYHEIASILGIGRSSVIEHVRRAMSRLVEELETYV